MDLREGTPNIPEPVRGFKARDSVWQTAHPGTTDTIRLVLPQLHASPPAFPNQIITV